MYKLFSTILLIFLFIMAGCTNSLEYYDEEIVAIVRGEEITIGELRFLYPDDKIFDYIDGAVKAKLAVQEAKQLKIDIDVSEQVKHTIEAFGGYPPTDMHEFTESQGKKLGMNPEEYYEKYLEITIEMNAYVVAYVKTIIGEPLIDEQADHNEQINQMLAYDEQGNELLNNLVEKNKNEIEILIR